MNEVFDQMKNVEGAAVIVQANADENTISNCRMMADKIMENRISVQRVRVLEHARKAFKFLYLSRRGFYCSLCNQPYHEHIDIYSSSIVSSNQFCQSMVEHTLNFYLFKFEYFMKISRLYSLFLITCDFKGRYNKSKFVAYQSKFYKNPEVLKGLEQCKNKIADPHGFKYCQDYCSNFNPARYSDALEGDIDRMKGYAAYLENHMEVKQIQYERESAKDVLNMKGRLLEALINRKIEMDETKYRQLSAKPEEKKPEEKKAEEKKPEEKKPEEKPKGKDAPATPAQVQAVLEPKSTINAMNFEMRSAILNPIMYNFNDDMTIEHSTVVHKSIFHQGFYKTYRIHKYKNYFDSEGINWYGQGKDAKIDKIGVREVMEMVPANDLMVRELFFEVMKD